MEALNKRVLDVCCGGRMFYFDKKSPHVLYVDNRQLELTTFSNRQKFSVQPDVVMDFRKLDVTDESFSMVVFDPPHLVRAGMSGWMTKKYGCLNRETWREDLTKGFAECFRVLKTGGFLIFKWNENDIKLAEVLALTPVQPLFGNKTPGRQMTHWLVFIK
jgi:23S rRNA G2069 N7-methylase RlmK/C1962 C5-methylase RlmI